LIFGKLPPLSWGSGAGKHPTFPTSKYPPGYNYTEATSHLKINFSPSWEFTYITLSIEYHSISQLYINMANPMENNKAVKMLKAAEEGGYGVIGVVSVCSTLHTK
jgi:hypothetical protein